MIVYNYLDAFPNDSDQPDYVLTSRGEIIPEEFFDYSLAVTAPKAKRGRPRIEDKDKTLTNAKPWVAAGMSRSSWYLRRKSLK